MIKKLFIMFMSVCMIFSFAACRINGFNRAADRPSSSDNKSDESSDSTKETDKTVEESEITQKEETQPIKETQPSTERKSDNKTSSDNKELKADEEYAKLPESTGFLYESNGDGTCVLKEIGKCSDKDIVIPEKSPKGEVITNIAENAFYDAKDISSVIFAGRNMELDSNAFMSCKVEKIVISGCNLTIDKSAFSYCDDISSIYISNSSINADNYAFYDSGKKTEITIKNTTGTLDEDSFMSCGATKLNIVNSTLDFKERSFSYCEDLEDIHFENSTVNIGSYAFYDSGDDAKITFADCVIDMDDDAFQSCGATTLSITGSETVIGQRAFSYCEDLTEVTTGANNTKIGEYAFYECTSLTKVSIAAQSDNDNIKTILNDNAFSSSAVQSVVIGRGDVKIKNRAFSYCEDLKNVELKCSSLKIGSYIFYECPNELSISYNGNQYSSESFQELK